jgi:hypothetical protein
MSEKREHVSTKLEVSLWLEQTTTTIRTSQITTIRILRTLRILRVLTAQTTAILTTTRRIARTAQTTTTISNPCCNGRRRDLGTGSAFSVQRKYDVMRRAAGRDLSGSDCQSANSCN